jgi:phage tail sheath protein FI
VWAAAAGVDATLTDVPALAMSLGDPEISLLGRVGANCLRVAPGVGPVVWGARTMADVAGTPSEWKYLSVRRTALWIEESISRGTRWAEFEPNGESLWAQLRLSVETFMDELFRQGAFPGSAPSEAYVVRCDEGTTTQADIDSGVVTIVVGFAPLLPAEFVNLRVQQLAGHSRD